MNKHSIITIIAIITIIIPFAYSGWNIFGTQHMEYRWDNPGKFSFFTMSNHGDLEMCNPMPFWTSFKKFEVATFYDSKHMGSFSINSTTLNPSSSTMEKGLFLSEELSAAQHIFMTMDFEFNDGDIRLDPNKFIIVVRTDTPILGIIPYSSTTQMSGFDFNKIMNVEDLSCD